ncbi:DUF357 domain-containing protein [Candidatus Woesearchaeota archaeon]|nr:DUF357 domain-containing protein [Candidatus Woesearchaeota archaeon]
MKEEGRRTVTDKKLDQYFDVTSRALAKVKIVSHIKIDAKKAAEDFLDMSEMQCISEHAQKPLATGKQCRCKQCLANVVFDMAKRYFSDAQHFKEKGDIVTAFAALNYAHGWLDAGARLGLFDVGHDSELFTVD